MGESIRELGPKDRDAAKDLWDRCFPVAPGSSYLDDFPVWDPARAVPERVILGAFEGERLIAAAGMVRARATLLPDGEAAGEWIHAGLVGAVCTDVEARGHGLATDLVTRLAARADEAGLPLSVLWSGEHSLYGKIGYALSGEQWRVPLSQFAAELPETGRAAEGWTDWMAEAFRLSDPERLPHFTEEGFLAAHRNVRWFGAHDEASGAYAFAALGRGMDLPAIVHEWGGDAEMLRDVLRAVLAAEPATEILLHPWMIGDLPFAPREEVDGIAEKLALLRWSPEVEPEDGEAAAKRIWFRGLEAV